MEEADLSFTKYLLNHSRNKTHVPPFLMYKWLKDLVNLFASLQELKMSHRDIKPDNFLLFNNE